MGKVVKGEWVVVVVFERSGMGESEKKVEGREGDRRLREKRKRCKEDSEGKERKRGKKKGVRVRGRE